MTVSPYLNALYKVICRQVKQIIKNPIYWVCLVIIPLLVSFFFVYMMKEGLPTNLPIGVVDQNNSATTRSLIRTLDSFQGLKVVDNYRSSLEARVEMQHGTIYGYFFIPKNMTEELISGKQPTISFYYNSGILLAGSFAYKDMKTIATLANASVAKAKMTALGYSEEQIKRFLQPIKLETHIIHNPTMDYNVYLSTTFIPACIGLFIFLMTAYSLGTELKWKGAKEWIDTAHNNIYVAVIGKLIPQTILFSAVFMVYLIYAFGYLDFPYACNIWLLGISALLLILSIEGLAVFLFSFIPSLRMAMSICALWGVLSFSISGFTFPVEAMDAPLQMVSWLFPLRHYFMIYQMNILNGYPIYYAWIHYLSLITFWLIPIILLPRLKKAMLTFHYMP